MKTLSLSERHSYILETLRQQGSVLVVDLANQLKVSSVTIRKDLTLLEEKEMLYRTHGSAILINPYINDRHVNEKEKSYPEEKRLIGRYAASLITADDSILIASGTTMHALAREIVPQGHLTVIAAAINVTNILARNKNIDIIQLGGFVRNSSVSVVGNYAEKMLEIMRANPLGKNAQIIGTCVEDENCFVQMETSFGGTRMVDWLSGEQLPRIC